MWEHVITKEITVKLLKIARCSQETCTGEQISLHHAISIALKMAEAD